MLSDPLLCLSDKLSSGNHPYMLFSTIQLIAEALDVMVHDPLFKPADGRESFLCCVSALHIVFKRNKQSIILFGQLVSLNAGVLLYLKERDPPVLSNEMV